MGRRIGQTLSLSLTWIALDQVAPRHRTPSAARCRARAEVLVGYVQRVVALAAEMVPRANVFSIPSRKVVLGYISGSGVALATAVPATDPGLTPVGRLVDEDRNAAEALLGVEVGEGGVDGAARVHVRQQVGHAVYCDSWRAGARSRVEWQ